MQSEQLDYVQSRIIINTFLNTDILQELCQQNNKLIDIINISLQKQHQDANCVYSCLLLSYQLSYYQNLFQNQQWNNLVKTILQVLAEYQLNTKIFPLAAKIMQNVFNICQNILCSSSVSDFIKFEAQFESTKKLIELIQDKIASLSNYENYINELQQNLLRNSPLHENNKFWTQNAKKIKNDKQLILNNLLRIGNDNIQKLYDENKINEQMQQSLLVIFNDIKKLSDIVDRETQIRSIDEEVMQFLAKCIELDEEILQKNAIQAMSKWIKMDE